MHEKIEVDMKNNNEAPVNMKLPKGVFVSPSTTMKVHLIHQTPVSAANTMYSYVQDQSRKAK